MCFETLSSLPLSATASGTNLRRRGRARVHTARQVPETEQRDVLRLRQRDGGDRIRIGRIHIVVRGRGRGRDGRVDRVIDVAGNAGETRRVRATFLRHHGKHTHTQNRHEKKNREK